MRRPCPIWSRFGPIDHEALPLRVASRPLPHARGVEVGLGEALVCVEVVVRFDGPLEDLLKLARPRFALCALGERPYLPPHCVGVCLRSVGVAERVRVPFLQARRTRGGRFALGAGRWCWQTGTRYRASPTVLGVSRGGRRGSERVAPPLFGTEAGASPSGPPPAGRPAAPRRSPCPSFMTLGYCSSSSTEMSVSMTRNKLCSISGMLGCAPMTNSRLPKRTWSLDSHLRSLGPAISNLAPTRAETHKVPYLACQLSTCRTPEA